MARRKTFPKIFVCGGNYERLQARSGCPNVLHDFPLPDGYVEASEVADARLRARWRNPRCADCGLYGWVPSAATPPSTHPVRVTLEPDR